MKLRPKTAAKEHLTTQTRVHLSELKTKAGAGPQLAKCWPQMHEALGAKPGTTQTGHDGTPL